MPKAGKQITDPEDGSRYTLVHTKTLRTLTVVSIWIGAMLTALLVLVAIELGHNNNQDSKLTALAKQTARLQREEAQHSLENCQRSNQARAASIREKEHTIEFTLEPQLKLWKGAIAESGTSETPEAVLKLLYSFLSKLERGIETTEQGIQKSIEAQAEVARYPDAKEPAKRSIVDCSLVIAQNSQSEEE